METSDNGLYNTYEIQFGCYCVVICIVKCYIVLMQGSMLTKSYFLYLLYFMAVQEVNIAKLNNIL